MIKTVRKDVYIKNDLFQRMAITFFFSNQTFLIGFLLNVLRYFVTITAAHIAFKTALKLHSHKNNKFNPNSLLPMSILFFFGSKRFPEYM